MIRPWKQGRIFYISYRLQFGDVSFGVSVNDAQKSVPLNYFLKGKMQYEQKKYENQRVVLRASNANRGRSNSSRLDPKPP